MNACCCTKYSSGCLIVLGLIELNCWICLKLLLEFYFSCFFFIFIWLTHVSLCWLDCTHTYIYIALDLYRTHTLILTYIVHIHWSWYTETCACFAYNMLSLLTFAFFSSLYFFALHKLLISLWKLHKCRRYSNDSVLHNRSSVVTFVVLLLLASCCCLLSYHNSRRQHHIHITIFLLFLKSFAYYKS